MDSMGGGRTGILALTTVVLSDISLAALRFAN